MRSTTYLVGFLMLSINSVSAVSQWGQCGGIGFTGSTQCDSNLVCIKINDYYFQCQVGTAQPTSALPVPTTTIDAPPSTTTVGATPSITIPVGSLTKIQNFGPSNVGMYGYRPANLKANPGLLVALHYCGGTAQAYYSGFQWKQQADQRGFLMLYGQAPRSNNCWDITSTASLSHEGGSDSLGIVQAVRYAIANWGVDASKVFVTGTSSGAMMTNILVGAYPDVFKAGAVFAGSPIGCLTADGPQNPPDDCQAGRSNKTPQQLGDRARQTYPGYTGPYPKIQLWHGTADPALNYNNLREEVKQWTNVHNISQTPTSTSANNPKPNWTKSVYGMGQVESYSGQGAGHGIPESGTESTAIDFFGL